MPYVEFQKVDDLDDYARYITKEEKGVEISSPDGAGENMAQEIRNEHSRFPQSRVKNLAYTIYQSWHPEDAGMKTVEEFNALGKKLAERWAPGHMAWVVTHTDKNHVHNHIVICAINSETGKGLVHTRKELKTLHDMSNKLARENGMREMQKRTNDLEAKLPDGVRKLIAKGKKSWVLDMVDKIDYARAASTSFDELRGQLKTLGVDAHIEDKNITYFYGERTKGVRGKSLGTKFDKEGLMNVFKENDEKFAKYPGLRDRIRTDIGAAFDGKGNSLGTPSDLLLESRSHKNLGSKDYGQFTKVERSRARAELPAIFDERGGVLYQEMKRAREVSIFDYCAEHKIKTKMNDKGQTVLAGKEFVVLGKAEWTNTKNSTKGTIIDFVAIHDETSYLRAVAKINKNPRLLLLEPVMGEYKRGFQSFFVPKPRAASPHEARKTLAAFTRARGMATDAAETLLKSDRLHVGHDRSIWLMGDKNESAMEFREEPDGKWRGKRHGKPAGAFFEAIAKGKQIVVHPDPFHFILHHGRGAVSPPGGASHFVMFDAGSSQRLDELLATNHHIAEVHLAHSGRSESQENERKMQRDFAARFNPFDIHVQEFAPARARDKARGPDFSL